MSPVPEYQALLEGTAFVRHTDRGIVRLRGSDRTAWLQGLVTNDIARLAGGQRCYNAYLTPQGRMITDLWVVSTPDTLLLDVPASLAASLATRFDGLIFAEDVQVDDASAMMAVVDVFGPLDAAVEPELVIPDSTYGVPSSVVYLPLAGLDAFLARLVPGRREVSLDALDVLRVEAGVPRFLVDMTDDTIPLEAGIEDRAISFTKGCYVGQEIIVRVTTRGGRGHSRGRPCGGQGDQRGLVAPLRRRHRAGLCSSRLRRARHATRGPRRCEMPHGQGSPAAFRSARRVG
jgi:folate-binding protein YgfZ